MMFRDKLQIPFPSASSCRLSVAMQSEVLPFLLFQQTAVQSSILFLSRTVDKILQTCSVVNNLVATSATIQTDMAVSDSDA